MIYPQTLKPHSKLAFKKTLAFSILIEQDSDNSTINAEGEIQPVSTFKIWPNLIEKGKNY